MTSRIAAALAAIAFTAASVPAIAHADPDGPARTSADKPAAKAELSAKEKRARICQLEGRAPYTQKVCQTRAEWIRQGRDPVASN